MPRGALRGRFILIPLRLSSLSHNYGVTLAAHGARLVFHWGCRLLAPISRQRREIGQREAGEWRWRASIAHLTAHRNENGEDTATDGDPTERDEGWASKATFAFTEPDVSCTAAAELSNSLCFLQKKSGVRINLG